MENLKQQYDSMQNVIIAHRGYWKSESEKNTNAAYIKEDNIARIVSEMEVLSERYKDV